jgi:head-tail adaptor
MVVMISAGSLDRRITILHDVGTELGATGVIAPDWQPLAPNVPASREDIGGAESERNPQVKAEFDVVFVTRWLNVGINAGMRIQDEDGRVYEIRSITPEPGRRAGYRIIARNLDALGAVG